METAFQYQWYCMLLESSCRVLEPYGVQERLGPSRLAATRFPLLDERFDDGTGSLMIQRPEYTYLCGGRSAPLPAHTWVPAGGLPNRLLFTMPF